MAATRSEVAVSTCKRLLETGRLASLFASKRRIGAISFSMLTLVVLLWSLGNKPQPASVAFEELQASQRTTMAQPLMELIPVSSWQVTLLDYRPSNSTYRFEGTQAIGQPLFVPAGTSFTVQTQPPGIPGRIVDGSDTQSWSQQGGAFELPFIGGHQVLTAPQEAGTYFLRWQYLHSSLPAKPIPILVLARAEAKVAKNGDMRLSVFGKELGVYKNPASSEIEAIRKFAHTYSPPEYFARLDSQNEQLTVGNNIFFGQMIAFMERYGSDGRKIILDKKHTEVLPPCPKLYHKLNLLRERLIEKGVKVTRFWITSGFRTPDYNARIGGACHSRHCYGDAVDLCIDEDGDLKMDDLNGDGRHDHKDGEIIAMACVELEREGLVEPGGIGVYGWIGTYSVHSHVHIDCRGYSVRWGQTFRNGRKVPLQWWPEGENGSTDGGD